MVGGNIAGQTRVLTTSIVLETSRGDLGAAVTQGGLLLVIALAAMFTVEGVRLMRPHNGSAWTSPEASGPLAVAHQGHAWATISVERDGVIVLDLEAVEVRGGEILVVMGASGAGKSTLLRAMAGLLPDVEGLPVKRGPGGVGRVAQNPVMLTRTRWPKSNWSIRHDLACSKP